MSLVADDIDVPDLHLRALVHHKGDLERGRRNLLDLRIHRGVLAAALGQKLLKHDGRALHLVGIVLRFHAQADFAFLEAVQDLADRDRLRARVVDGADDTALVHHEAHDHAGSTLLGLQADIVEAAGIPQDHEVAAKGFFVINIARLGEDQGLQGVLRERAWLPGTQKLRWPDPPGWPRVGRRPAAFPVAAAAEGRPRVASPVAVRRLGSGRLACGRYGMVSNGFAGLAGGCCCGGTGVAGRSAAAAGAVARQAAVADRATRGKPRVRRHRPG